MSNLLERVKELSERKGKLVEMMLDGLKLKLEVEADDRKLDRDVILAVHKNCIADGEPTPCSSVKWRVEKLQVIQDDMLLVVLCDPKEKDRHKQQAFMIPKGRL